MTDIAPFVTRFHQAFPNFRQPVWHLPSLAEQLIHDMAQGLPSGYRQSGDCFIHDTATVEPHVTLKGKIIIGPGCFIGAHAYLRGGVFLDERVVIGPGCEVKSAFIFRGSALAHFNFAGDSIIGEDVNMEAGSILANHYNEREDKSIHAIVNGGRITLPVTKFGSLIGDHSRIGANAVLSPGSVLDPGSVVRRLELVDQVGM